jgi:hypothetical protein
MLVSGSLVVLTSDAHDSLGNGDASMMATHLKSVVSAPAAALRWNLHTRTQHESLLPAGSHLCSRQVAAQQGAVRSGCCTHQRRVKTCSSAAARRVPSRTLRASRADLVTRTELWWC